MVRYAFFPGCVSRGGCPELYPAAMQVCRRLGIELEELTGASCTGAGVLQEKNQFLGDVLNARTFAMAEFMGLPIMTICSTCQGVMSQANKRLKDDQDYLAKVNTELAEEYLEYKGTATIKHLLWVIIEDVGLEALRGHVTTPLTHPARGPVLRLLHPPTQRCSRLRRASRAPDLIRNDYLRPWRPGGGLLRQKPMLRLPYPDHQRAELGGNGGQAYHGSLGPGRRRHGNPMPSMSPEP